VDAVAEQALPRSAAHARAARSWLTVAAFLYLALIVFFLYIPSGLVALMSFNVDELSSFPIEGLTLDWWRDLFASETVLEAARNSLVVALLTTVITIFLGVLTAYALVRLHFRLKGALVGLLIATMLIPYLVVGIALLSFWALLGVSRGLHLVVLAHVALALPYAALVIAARLQGFDRSLEEAAAILGAGRLTTFRRVVLPILMPGIVAAAALTFAISIDEFNVAYFLVGTDTTLPIYIFSSLRFGVTPTLNAISTLILAVSIVLSLIALRRGRV
jgi:spermidine/putrescine transport system permease protein